MDPAERILARRQVQFAHLVCLSKCDLVDAARVTAVESEIRGMNPSARIVRLPFGLPDLAALLQGVAAEVEVDSQLRDPQPESGTEPHLHQQFHSLTWRVPVALDRSRFEAYLSGLNPRQVVRAKGFVRFQRQPESVYVFQSVFGHAFIEEFRGPAKPNPVVVLIGPDLDLAAQRERLRALAFGGPGRSVTVAGPLG